MKTPGIRIKVFVFTVENDTVYFKPLFYCHGFEKNLLNTVIESLELKKISVDI